MSPAKKTSAKTSKTKAPKKKTSKIPVRNLTTANTAGKKVSAPEAEAKPVVPEKAKAPSKPKPKAESKPLSSQILPEKKIEPKQKIGKSKTYRNIAMFFIIGALFLLVLIFYFTFLKLTITIIPQTERLADETTVTVYDKNKLSQIPSTLESVEGVVEKIKIEEEKKYSSTGVDVIGEEVVGKVTIVNNYSKNQPLVATTRLLSSDKKLYRLKETVNVPAGGSIEASVYADKASPEMAIGPSKFTIPGLWAGLQDKIYAESKTKFTYGQQTKKYIEQKDIDNGVADIKKALLESAKKKLGSSYKGFDYVIYELDENSIKSEVKGKVGEEREDVSISMSADVSVVAFSSEAMEKLASGKLSIIVPDNKELVEFKSDSMEYVLESYDVNQGSAKLKVSFWGLMSLKQGAEIIDASRILGLNRKQLEAYLNSVNEIYGYDLKFSPSFINRVPKLIDRIKVEVQ